MPMISHIVSRHFDQDVQDQLSTFPSLYAHNFLYCCAVHVHVFNYAHLHISFQ